MHSDLSADTWCKSPLRVDDDKEKFTLEVESETCSDSLGWVGGKIHGHLCSSAGRDDEMEEEEARTYVAYLPLVRKKKTELHP